MLDEATARASAIHDGAERRLDLLKNRHAEAMRRLTEIRDVVTDLVAHDDAKGTMDEEVDKAVAATLGTSAPPGKPGGNCRRRRPSPSRRGRARPGRPRAPGPPARRRRTARGNPDHRPQTRRPPSPAGGQPGEPRAPAARDRCAVTRGAGQDSAAAGTTAEQRARHAAPHAQAGPGSHSPPQAKPGQGTSGETKNNPRNHISADEVRIILP